ncbi:hypothetical protein RV17_GL001591 [Enterococcus thailandicus]|nr:hypothetical protein RV17_GL001591 [Enterococcus thailandicus]
MLFFFYTKGGIRWKIFSSHPLIGYMGGFQANKHVFPKTNEEF